MNKYDRPIAVYNFILRYYADTGFMPTVNEIVHGTPYRSTSSTAYALKLLAIWKWIKHEPTTKRAITLTRPTERGMSAAELKAMLERSER